jgi:hypothetical protein
MSDKKPAPPTPDHVPVNPTVAPAGVPGFHPRKEEGDDHPLASQELDADAVPGRVNTGTGDQPGNISRERFGSTPENQPAED